MGIYYDWVNIDKREFISPNDFDSGNKIYESTGKDDPTLGALYNLLGSDWQGDAVFFLGDETPITADDDNPVLQRLLREAIAAGESPDAWVADYVCAHYQCLSDLFKAGSACYFDGEPGPPVGELHARESRFYRYTINHTKKEYFDRETIRWNPLPLLLAFPALEMEEYCGAWLGDRIEVSDEPPAADYQDKSGPYDLDD